MGNLEKQTHRPVEIYRGGPIKLYELNESEVDKLKGPGGLSLGFATFLISSAISFLIALATGEITSNKTYYTFLVIVLVSGISGLFFGIKTVKDYISFSKEIKKIKERKAYETTGFDYALAKFLRLIRYYEENHKFLSIKWLREKKFAGNPEYQEFIQICIDKEILLTERIPNPKKQRFPIKICMLNKEHPMVQRVFGDTLKE